MSLTLATLKEAQDNLLHVKKTSRKKELFDAPYDVTEALSSQWAAEAKCERLQLALAKSEASKLAYRIGIREAIARAEAAEERTRSIVVSAAMEEGSEVATKIQDSILKIQEVSKSVYQKQTEAKLGRLEMRIDEPTPSLQDKGEGELLELPGPGLIFLKPVSNEASALPLAPSVPSELVPSELERVAESCREAKKITAEVATERNEDASHRENLRHIAIEASSAGRSPRSLRSMIESQGDCLSPRLFHPLDERLPPATPQEELNSEICGACGRIYIPSHVHSFMCLGGNEGGWSLSDALPGDDEEFASSCGPEGTRTQSRRSPGALAAELRRGASALLGSPLKS